MASAATVLIHPSQFPANVRRALVQSLRRRQVNHKFHYDSVRQAQQWLRVHEAYAPSRNDPQWIAAFDRAFEAALKHARPGPLHLIGLGCGGGQKDRRLLELARADHREVIYTPCDVSAALVLVAREAALNVIPSDRIHCRVCDLTEAPDLDAFLGCPVPNATRLATFFGMLPNFEPDHAVAVLKSLVRPGSVLIASANLMPAGASASAYVLSQYDNELTREWLLRFLLDVGVEREDGALRVELEEVEPKTHRIVARFEFARPWELRLDSDEVAFSAGDRLRVFFSYRYTADRVRDLVERAGVRVVSEERMPSGEEAIFVCRGE
ncbi:MAG TPA: L-histidine N(alpha)-methyltransferase [Verrucomicrobia bacterium]|nr:L-histidine N(alpha)-methyltransferase [Verrucomicrobiota bacterium]HOB32909.1 L-histidine N(alpha)-methyltransferase [Verrucomicrobiota bacterium]HOP97500.1 L-histidine N(alpha)-methyltransferase [Verrucomicrobiota bacterium]